MKLHLLFLSFLFIFQSIVAQSLMPGDIAIIGLNTDNPDDFSFVALVDLPASTEIRFTDSGVFSDGSFRANEGAVKYTSPNLIPAGTIITFSANSANFATDNDAGVGTSGFNLSASGDQIIAFQGVSSNPTYIFAVQSYRDSWDATASTSNNSALPTGLISGYTAVSLGNSETDNDNAVYDMLNTSGAQNELLTLIANTSNWIKSSSSLSMPSGTFTVGGETTTPDPPVALEETSLTHESFTANWNSSSGATTYFLDVSENSSFSSNLAGFDNLNVGNVTNYLVTGLYSTSPYFYRVRASNSAGTSGNSNVIDVTTGSIPLTTVQFSSASGSVLETGGTYNLQISILNPSATVATTADVVLTSGQSEDIDGFTPTPISFPAGSSVNQTVTLTITDDGITEGNETLTFAIQSVSGGNNAMVGSQAEFNLTIIESAGGDYYDGIDPNKSTFLTDLKNRIRTPYYWVPYSQFDETNIANFASKDNGDGTSSVFCVYSNYEYEYSGTFAWDVFSREHTFPHSWMPTNPANEPVERDEYADQHHLFPTHQEGANSVRSNHPLGDVTNASDTFGEARFGTDAFGNTVFEPRDEHKGDAARAILYMIVRYDDIDGYDWGLNAINDIVVNVRNQDPQDLDLLLAWHNQDPPDQWEFERNDYIQSIQGNRNPFVDHPEYVNYIDFYEVEYLSNSLFFSEYVEGSSNNKALEIFNNTGSNVDLGAQDYKVQLYANGSNTGSSPINLTGLVNDGGVFVISNSSAAQAILDVSDQTTGSINYNGNDAIALLRGTEIVDVIGQIGFDPGDEWGTGDVSTQDNTIRRKSSIGIGDADGSDAFDPAEEWNGFALDTFDGLGSHIVNDGPPSITNLTRTPKVPASDENALITAEITDDIGVSSVILKYTINDGAEQELVMSNTAGSTYEATIPSSEYSNGNILKYKIYAEDEDHALTISTEEKVFTGTTPIENLNVLDEIDKRLVHIDAYARIAGVATVESGIFSPTSLDIYIQDETGGINIFKQYNISTILRGYNYIVEGKLDQYNGKAELVPDNLAVDIKDGGLTSVPKLGFNKTNAEGVLPDPVVLTISQFLDNPESYEGMLVGIQHLFATDGEDAWPLNDKDANFEVTDDGGISKLLIRVDRDTEIDGTAEPTWPKDVVGIFNQYDVAAPYTWGYQIQPRDLDDIQEDGALPVELITFIANITENSVILNWETATEVNNYGFEVERKVLRQAQNDSWNKIGFVEGHGNSNSKKIYNFSDNSVSASGKYSYRLKQIDIDGQYEYSQTIEIEVGIPTEFEVAQNYPNPFNPTTTISYSIPERINVTIDVFNMLGQRVLSLLDKEHLPGKYKIELDASNLSSGTYIYRVSTSKQSVIRKMMILK